MSSLEDKGFRDQHEPAVRGQGPCPVLTAHTPGPWRVVNGTLYGPNARAVIERGSGVSLMLGGEPEAEHIANATLRNAAPELLDALQNLLAVHEGDGGTRYHAGDIARAAIARALGQSAPAGPSVGAA